MKIIFFMVILLYFVPYKVMRGSIVASVTYATYHSDKGDFMDLFIAVQGRSMHYVPKGKGEVEAKLGIVVTIRNQNEIHKVDSLVLVSPKAKEVLDFKQVLRYPLDTGYYFFEVELYDIYQTVKNSKLKAAFNAAVIYDTSHIFISDILLLSSYWASDKDTRSVKSGLYLDPLPFNVLVAQATQLPFYLEVYRPESQQNKGFALRTQIFKDSMNGELVQEHYKKVPEGVVGPMLLISSVRDLVPGIYYLKVGVINEHKDIYAQKGIVFKKYGKSETSKLSSTQSYTLDWVEALSTQELRYSLKALSPIVGQFNSVVNKALKANDIPEMRRLLTKYWIERFPRDSEKQYRRYMRIATEADKKFKSGFGYGFESDRGRIFMKYGRPSHVITESAEPEAFPYEIWIYNQTPDGQTHVKFLFYNPTLAANQMVLLHSNAVGEYFNDKWERVLYSKATSDPQPRNYHDEQQVPDGFFRRAREYFDDN